MAGSTEAAKKAWETRRRNEESDPEGVRARRRAAALKAWAAIRKKAKADPAGTSKRRQAAALKAWKTRRAAIPAGSDGDQVTLRIPFQWLDRTDALVDRLAMDPNVGAAMTVSRLTVLRVALLRGIEVLERELPKPKS